jgi:hypothetical protein
MTNVGKRCGFSIQSAEIAAAARTESVLSKIRNDGEKLTIG